ncbi:DNRLRE domain-containing protein [Peribacillus frigoritolerans]|uniref:DNRLRE domain-containing protein n=1 Tax=Peribacillus frigoritolerans TaxID=450367 RepID=UPI0010593975|nr:DNRLRE domain-containing protein [Peribacillus frigoritolerans]TDL76108.1 DNRLRE domain-containing protein [Peribacillus frigoritolerans]
MSSTFKTFYRYVAMLLSICLIISVVGPSFTEAASGAAKRTPKKENLTADIGELPNKPPKEKMELTNKRTPFSKRYLNPDGSFTEEIFMEQQFYHDPSDKKWKKIDNKLKNSSKKPGKFENTANNTNTVFAQQSGNVELVSVEKGGKNVSFIPIKANKVQGALKDNEITYKEILHDVDYRYSVHGSAVKEDIVINQYQNQNTFSFELKMKGVTPHKEKNGTIVFKDSKGNKLWFFENPYMTDAKGKYSEKVSLDLREENGKTFVDVVADQAFLKDQGTQYPVTIDPTIDSWDVLRDNFVASSFPDSVYSSNTYMHTGFNSYFGTTRSFVQFSLPNLPSDSSITSATFNAYQTKVDATNSSIDLFRINSSWTSTATWDSQPTVGASAETTTTNNASNAYWQWTITQLVKDWYNGVQPNYGFMLKQQNETTSPYRTFTSVNNGNNTPRLTINYTVDSIGVEKYWGLTKDSVNPANGNLVLQDTDLSIPGRGIPVSIKRTYNSRKSFAGMFGFGWTSNYEARLVDAGSGPITLIDEDNTRHIFGEKVGGGYISNGGVYLALVKNGDGTYTITQVDGTKINFNTSGKVSSLVDMNGNTTTLTYNTNGKLSTIKDATTATPRTTTITYGANGYVSSITDPANRTISYGYDASGNLTTVTDAENKVTTLTYDGTHNVTSIKDARNITTTIAYDASDRVKTMSLPITIDGVQQTSATTYSYDPTNLVTSVTDGEGRKVNYTYNANGNIVQVTENPLDSANKAVTTFTYDNNNNLTQVKDANTNKVNGTAAWVYTYDANGNITSVKLPENQTASYTYDSQSNLIKEQDFNSNISTSDYDTKNNQTESTDANVQTSASRYAANGNVEYDTHPMSAADNQITNSSIEIDNNTDNWADNWTQAIEPGKTATFDWSNTAKYGTKAISISNPTGWAIAKSDKLVPYVAGNKYIVSGYVKTTSTTNTAVVKVEFLDSTGTWISEKPAYQLKGTHDWTRIQAVVDNVPANTANIRVSVGLNAGTGTAYFDGIQLEKGTVLSAYNHVENSSFERNTGAGEKVPFGWKNSGNLSANDGIYQNGTGEDNVYVGTYSFKLTGEKAKNKFIKQRINLSGDANTPLTMSGWSKQAGADANGGSYVLQVQINYTDGTVGTFANDFSKTSADWQHVAAQVKPIKAFNSVDALYLYDDQLGTAWFDSMRLEIGSSFTFNTYDTGGNYLTNVDSSAGSISYTYDGVGNQTSMTDGKGKKTSFAYDALNRLTKVTDANLGNTFYGYDGVGNQTSVTDANNHVTNYTYNEWNLISSIKNPLNQVIQFGYDKNGNMTKLIYPKGDSVSYTYNGLNLKDSISYNGVKKWDLGYDANGNETSVTNTPTGKTTTYTYDKNNRLTKEEEGTSNSISYGYDANSNLNSLTVTTGATSITNEYSYNSLDQVTALTRNGVNQAKFIYDESGNTISTSKSNGTYASFDYDEANRLKSVKNYNAAGALLDSYTYTYDANGNHTRVVTSSGTISYQYDALNQLTNETLADGTTISYEYDKVGNRTKKIVTQGGTTTTTNYTYDAANQLTAVNGQAYTYDMNGNLKDNGAKTYIYDVENRLIEVKNSAGTSLASFTYDKDGKRLSMTTASGTTNFHYSGDKVIYETDANNNIVASYTWDAQGNPVSMTKNGKTYYYHVNGHGDVTALTDANGATVAQYKYDAWGNIISKTGTMADSNPYRYAGYRFDNETGLYYLMARYYDSNVGRFITRDTFQGFANDPQSLNLYAYVNNNPVINVDPSGHFKVISVSWAATLIDVSLGALAGGGVGAIAAYIRKKGKKEAARMFTKTIKSRLIAWGAPKLAYAVAGAVAIAMDRLEIGTAVAKYLDKKDKKPGNGWLDV